LRIISLQRKRREKKLGGKKMIFGKKKKKASKEDVWLSDIILEKFKEGYFFQSYSSFVDKISSLGYSKEKVKEIIRKMPEIEIWSVGSCPTIVKAGEADAMFAVINSDGGM
jgi:hypothetical protein